MGRKPALVIPTPYRHPRESGDPVGSNGAHPKSSARSRQARLSFSISSSFQTRSHLLIRFSRRIAAQVNESVENIETVTVDAAYVSERLAGLAQDADLSKYVL